LNTFLINPFDFGINQSSLVEVKGGELDVNLGITMDILNNYEEGAKKNIALLNAAAAISVSEKSVDIKEALDLARESLESGAALLKLKQLREYSQRFNNA
jgi:anthranilate phosphoribosyltransferase